MLLQWVDLPPSRQHREDFNRVLFCLLVFCCIVCCCMHLRACLLKCSEVKCRDWFLVFVVVFHVLVFLLLLLLLLLWSPMVSHWDSSLISAGGGFNVGTATGVTFLVSKHFVMERFVNISSWHSHLSFLLDADLAFSTSDPRWRSGKVDVWPLQTCILQKCINTLELRSVLNLKRFNEGFQHWQWDIFWRQNLQKKESNRWQQWKRRHFF